MTGPSDDPSDRQTRMASYDVDGWQQVLEHEPDAADPDAAPDPWYRNRILLALWALVIALLLTLVIYGLVELSRGGGGNNTGPTSTTSSTTSTPPSSTSPPTTPSTITETPPPPETPEQTPDEAPPPANNSPAQPPPRHHHHFHLPHLF